MRRASTQQTSNSLSLVLASMPNKKPVSRACGPCRKSKVKCDRKFPCGRCLRMRIACEDPTTGRPEEFPLPAVSACHMLPTIATAPAFALYLARYGPRELAREKAISVMHVLAAVYRRRGCERLKRMVENLALGLGADFAELARPRTEAEAEAEKAGVATHFPLDLFSPTLAAPEAMHPYAQDVFKAPFVSMAAVVVGGQERVFANDAWAQAFFGAEEAQRRLQEEGLRPEELFASIVHPDDRAFIVPMVDNCFFGTADTVCESTHIFRCHSPRTQASFVALARLRAVVTPEGYFCTVYSVQPLPFPPDMIKVSMPVGGVVAGRQPWHELVVQHERGDHADMTAPLAFVPASAASVGSSAASSVAAAASWSARRRVTGTGGRRSSGGSVGGRRGGIHEGEDGEEDEDDDDESGRESFRSSDVGRDSFRESFRYSDAAASVYSYGGDGDGDDEGRASVVSATAEEAARAVAALGMHDVGTPRSSLGEDRPPGATAVSGGSGVPAVGAGAAGMMGFPPGQVVANGAGGFSLRPPQPPVSSQQQGDGSGGGGGGPFFTHG